MTATVRATTARRARRATLLTTALALASGVWLADLAGGAFSLQTGMSKKQAKSTMHTRGQLKPQVLEIPLDEEEPEPAPREPLLERRMPYTMHIVTQFPNAQHLREESAARRYVEEKIIGALENAENLVKHVEVRLQVLEHFHRQKIGHKKVTTSGMDVIETTDGEVIELPAAATHANGAKMMAPYQLKIIVSLKNHHQVIYSKPEKHAQNTLFEATDYAVDGLKRLMREEKDKQIQKYRKAREVPELSEAPFTDEDVASDEAIIAEEVLSKTLELQDSAMEEFYNRMEADDEAAPPKESTEAVPEAVVGAKAVVPVAEAPAPKIEKRVDSVAALLMR